jgi:OPA family glycerol-3-phosphate transporter-like MFS transporter
MLGIILQGSLRDGVTTWMPSYLTESFGLTESGSIAITVVLAVLSMVSFYAFNMLYEKLVHDEALSAAIIFVGSAVSSAALYFADRYRSVIVTTAMMALIVACMHGVNLMFISVTPKRFAPIGRISTFSGVLNSCTYVGAALSTYLFAKVAETDGLGSSFNIILWTAVSAVGVIISVLAAFGWRRAKLPRTDD